VYISGENLLLSYLPKQPNASRLFLFCFPSFLSFFLFFLNQKKTNPFLSRVLKEEERISVNRKENLPLFVLVSVCASAPSPCHLSSANEMISTRRHRVSVLFWVCRFVSILKLLFKKKIMKG